MGYVNDLAVACRSSGLTVWEDPRWGSRNHGAFTTTRPTAIICHHTGSSGSGAWTVVRDGRSDLAGPLAQLTLERDGSVRVLANGQAWHAGTGSWPSIGRNNANSRAIGIEAVYNGSDITDVQRLAYPRLCAALCRHYGIAVGNVIGHREWAPDRKVDPGKIDLPAFRREVQALVNGGVPAPAPAPANTPTASRPTLRRTDSRVVDLVSWVSAYQEWANPRFSYAKLTVDGWFGRGCEAFTKTFQQRCGLTPDGVVGPKTWAKADENGFRR